MKEGTGRLASFRNAESRNEVVGETSLTTEKNHSHRVGTKERGGVCNVSGFRRRAWIAS